MVLAEFSYVDRLNWQISGLSLNNQNLIVGMNAVGQSRTLAAIGNVVRFIKGDIESGGSSFYCAMKLVNGHQLDYSIDVHDGIINSEALKKDGVALISRDSSGVSMYGDKVKVKVISANKDTSQIDFELVRGENEKDKKETKPKKN